MRSATLWGESETTFAKSAREIREFLRERVHDAAIHVIQFLLIF